jgi:hypothetical protein
VPNGKLTPDTRVSKVSIVRIKKRPRGKSFEPGNGFGSEHRFKKGMPSANPSGRPLCKEISKALNERLAATKPILAKTGAEKIAKVWEQQARDGNIAAIVSLANRVEGCPATSVTVNEETNKLLDLAYVRWDERSDQIGPPEGQVQRQLEDNENGDS